MTIEPREAARERLRPYVERARNFTGWTAFPETRALSADYPWDYMARARELVTASSSVLDMGTGGGERFADIIEGRRLRAVATEEWHVNAPVAAAHLRGAGAAVVRARSAELPFAEGAFDLVLNRHEELDPAEVACVLRPGGSILTQQVWGYWPEIDRFFGRRGDFGDHFHLYQDGFVNAGLLLQDVREHRRTVAFESVGDLIYTLCVASWEVPNFDPLDAHLGACRFSEPAESLVSAA